MKGKALTELRQILERDLDACKSWATGSAFEPGIRLAIARLLELEGRKSKPSSEKVSD